MNSADSIGDMSRASLDTVHEWTTRLTGLPAESITRARSFVEETGIPHLRKELCDRPDIDAVAGACMLHRAFLDLSEGGVDESKLLSKLRGDKDAWPTVIELIAGSQLRRTLVPDWNVELDHGEKGESNADFFFTRPDLVESFVVEFKAIGLSYGERLAFRNAAALLPSLCPRFGIVTMETDDALALTPGNSPSRKDRRRMERDAKRRSSSFPPSLRDTTAAVVVEHLNESAYLTRTRDRVEGALRQLPSGQPSWVAIWWTNGAPTNSVLTMLRSIDLPEHVLGIFVVGAVVVFPDPRIHIFNQIVSNAINDEDDPEMHSDLDDSYAKIVYRRVEGTSATRPTMIVDPAEARRGRVETVMFRDGSRPHLPFNLVFDRDEFGPIAR